MRNANGWFSAIPMYEFYSTKDKDHPPPNCKYRVPLAIQLTCGFQGTVLEGTDYVFLLDRSGSMGPHNPTGVGKGWGPDVRTRFDATRKVVGLVRLRSVDRFALIPFDETPTVPSYGLQPAARLAELTGALAPPDRGLTNIAAAVRVAVQVLKAADNRRPRMIILLTDGDAYMGEGTEAAQADAALRSMEEVGDAGIDFAALGLGEEWNQNLLRDMNALAGNRGLLYIDSEQAAGAMFARLIKEQQEVVGAGWRFTGVLNTRCFGFEHVRALLPEKTVSTVVRLRGTAPLGGGTGSVWSHPLANVRGDRRSKEFSRDLSKYILILEATPLPDLKPGVYTVGLFGLENADGAPVEPAEVKLTVTDGKITGSKKTCPQNPWPPVCINWRQSLIPDIDYNVNKLMSQVAGRKKGRPPSDADVAKAREQADLLLEILAEGGAGSVVDFEEAKAHYQEIFGDGLTPAQKEIYLKVAAVKSTTTTAPVTEELAREALQDEKWARPFKSDSEGKFKRGTGTDLRQPPRS
jgi:hypothetical protein